MKLITRISDYAIRAVAEMARRPGIVYSVPDLVRSTKIPRPFLRKILQGLGRAGILRSERGKSGGFVLDRRPEEVRLVDILKAFQGEFKLNECLFKDDICPNTGKCLLKKKIDGIEGYVLQQLRLLTIADILKKAR